MSLKLPILKPTELVKILKKSGFEELHQTGSHLFLKHPQTKKMTSVPIHPRDLKKGLLRKILRQADISLRELLKLR